MKIVASRKRGRLERNEEGVHSEREDNFEQYDGRKVPLKCNEEYEFCARHKEWVRRADDYELESQRYLDDDELEIRWTNWVNIYFILFFFKNYKFFWFV